MTSGYFHRIARETPTRLWINNPNGNELDWSLAAGAINGTTNPMYCARLLKAEPDYIRPIIDQAIREVEDNDIAADLVVQRATARFMEKYLPLYEKSAGTQGLVTIQDDPHKDDDPAKIINAAQRHGRVGRNYMAKIPVTIQGLEAMAWLIERNVPICATEVFAIGQAIAMCELYERVSRRSGQFPPFFLTHITGIYDEELKAQVEQGGISIEPEVLRMAGTIVARRQYHLVKERQYRTTLLGGGARGTYHFTEFIGGDFHITMNWSTINELIQADEPVVRHIDDQVPQEWIVELEAKLPDFAKAYHEDALTPAQFEQFAPLQRFRNNFLAGYDTLLAEVAARRSLLAV